MKSFFGWRFILLLALSLVWGCSPSPAPTPEVPATPTGFLTPTPSPVWFPPTATYTPFPNPALTPSPTPVLALASLILQDDFTPPGLWQTFKSQIGNAAYEDHQLTLAVATPKGYLFSLRGDLIISDAYLEISLQPNLCRGDDAFGLLFRAVSEANTYRLVLTCRGQMRLERLREGRALPLSDWIDLSETVVNPLVETRLGVWMYRDQLRVFVNGFEELAVRDPVYSNGGLGVFARAAGETALSVSFRNLQIFAINPLLLSAPSPTP
jgi:hypothetical protein